MKWQYRPDESNYLGRRHTTSRPASRTRKKRGTSPEEFTESQNRQRFEPPKARLPEKPFPKTGPQILVPFSNRSRRQRVDPDPGG